VWSRHFKPYHAEGVEIFKNIPTYDAYFYQQRVNKMWKFSLWCISADHFEPTIARLKAFSDISLEYVVPYDNGLKLPQAFHKVGIVHFFEI
jgi:hypothetical protein